MNIERFIQFAPDEPNTGEKPPERVTVDGVGEIAFADLVNGFKFSRANHERAEQLKAGFEQLQAERNAWEQRNAASQAEREGFLQTLERVAAPRQEGTRSARINLAEALGQVEIVADEKAAEKLGQVIDLAFEQREQELTHRHQEDMNRMSLSFQQKLEQELQGLRSERTRETASQTAERANEETFQRVLRQQLGEEGFRAMTETELTVVRKQARGQYTPETGMFDAANQWRWRPEGVEKALWAAEPTRKRLLEKAKAEARVQGLGHRVAMESASASTPSRQPRQPAVNLDENVKNKMNNIRHLLNSRQISPVEAQQMMGDDAPKMLAYLQEQARGGGG